MNELKIEHVTTSTADTFQITRGETTISLDPQEALLCLQFLYSNLAEITALVNDLPKVEQEANPYQLSGGFMEAVTGSPYATQNPRIGLEPEEPTLLQCPYCNGHHPTDTIEQCPLKPKTFMQQTQPDENTRFRASWLDDDEHL